MHNSWHYKIFLVKFLNYFKIIFKGKIFVSFEPRFASIRLKFAI